MGFGKSLFDFVGYMSFFNPIGTGRVSDSLEQQEDFSEDALVLVMEHSQREKILEKYGHADPENVYVLTELVGDELEIIDPYGGTLQAYGLCYETMRKTILKLVNLLNESEDNGTD